MIATLVSIAIFLLSVLAWYRNRKPRVSSTAEDAIDMYEEGKSWQNGRNQKRAMKWFKKALPALKEHQKEASEEYVRCLLSLGVCYRDKKEYEKAAKLWGEAVKLAPEVLGEADQDYIGMLCMLGHMQASELGRVKRGQKLLNRASVLAMKKGDLQQYACVEWFKGKVYFGRNEPDKAGELFESAVKIMDQAQADTLPDYALMLNDYSLTLMQRQRYAEALQALLKSVEVMDETGAFHALHRATSRDNVAEIFARLCQPQRAAENRLKCVELLEGAVGEEHEKTVKCRADLAVDRAAMADERIARALADPKQRICDVCLKTGGTLFKCSKCQTMRYCSEECQQSTWKEHKKVCAPRPEHPCQHCLKAASLKCPRCVNCFYCSKDCQMEDRSLHVLICGRSIGSTPF